LLSESKRQICVERKKSAETRRIQAQIAGETPERGEKSRTSERYSGGFDDLTGGPGGPQPGWKHHEIDGRSASVRPHV
jgi:hypothetical protein